MSRASSQGNTRLAIGFTLSLMVVGCSGEAPRERPAVHTQQPLTVGALNRTFMTDGVVNAVLELDDTIYLGGSFSYVGQRSGPWAAVDASTGARDKAYPELGGGAVYTAVSDGNGGWYLGGSFRTVGAVRRRGLAHLRADKTVDPGFNVSANGNVYALQRVGSTLLVGGDFSTLGGETRRLAGAIDLTQNRVTSWHPNVVGSPDVIVPSVRALAVHGDAVVMGGFFHTVQGVARRNLTAVDRQTGAPTVWPGPTDAVGGSIQGVPIQPAPVEALAVHGSTLFVGGAFVQLGTVGRRNLAALNVTTGALEPWDPRLSDSTSVSALKLSGSTLYVGGAFGGVGGAARSSVAAFDADTRTLLDWAPDLTRPVLANFPLPWVRALHVDEAQHLIYLGGSFASVGGAERRNLAAVDATTAVASAWNVRAENQVAWVARDGATVLVGGVFTSVGGQPRTHLAAIDAQTRRVTAWKPRVSGTHPEVRALAASDGRVFVGGYFANANSNRRAFLAAFTRDTGAVTSFNARLDGAVDELLVAGSSLYVAGTFSHAGGVPRSRLAAFDIEDGSLRAFTAPSGLDPRALAGNETRVYVGNGLGSIRALDATTGEPISTFGEPVANGQALALAATESTVYVGGDFSTIATRSGTQPRAMLAALDAQTGELTPFAPEVRSTAVFAGINAFALTPSTLYVGGAFSSVDGAPRYDLAAVELGTGALLPLAPEFNRGDNRVARYPFGVLALSYADGHLNAGGDFRSVGSIDQSGFARFTVAAE